MRVTAALKSRKLPGQAALGRRGEGEEALARLPVEGDAVAVRFGPALELVVEVGLDVLGPLAQRRAGGRSRG